MKDAYLVPLAPEINGISLLCGKKIVVGRNTTASHYILSKNVSKEHLSLQQDQDQNWSVLDLKSLNGTYINDNKLEPFIKVILEEGDIVDIVKPYKYKFTKNPLIISKILEESQLISTANNKLRDLKRPTLQANKIINATTDEDGTDPPVTKKTKLNNLKESSQVGDKVVFVSPLKHTKNFYTKGENTYPPTMVLKNNPHYRLTNQLKSEIIAKDELISVLRMDFMLKKDKWGKEKIELEDKLKIAYDSKLEAKDAQIQKLLERQKGMTAEIQSVQDVEKNLRHQIDKLNKHQKLLSSTLERKDKELADIKVSKEGLEKELAKYEVERVELLKNFEHSFSTESKLSDQRKELIRSMTTIIEVEFQCVICQDLLIKATVMNCGHIFCLSCLETWLQNKKQCPVCRKHYQQKYHLLLLDNYLDSYVEKYGEDEYKRKRAELKAQREQRASIAISQSRTTGSYMARSAARNATDSFMRLLNLSGALNGSRRPRNSNGRRRSLHFGLGPLSNNALAELVGGDEENAAVSYYDINDILNRYLDEPDVRSNTRPTRPNEATRRGNQPYSLRSSTSGPATSTRRATGAGSAEDVITISDAGPSSAATSHGYSTRARTSNASNPGPSNNNNSPDADNVIYIDFENGEGFSTDFSASEAESLGPYDNRRRNNRGRPRTHGNMVGERSRHAPTYASDVVTHDVSTTDDDFDEEEIDRLIDQANAGSTSGDDDDSTAYEDSEGGDQRSSRPVSAANREPAIVTMTTVSTNGGSSSSNTITTSTCNAICPKCRSRGHISRHCPRNRNHQ